MNQQRLLSPISVASDSWWSLWQISGLLPLLLAAPGGAVSAPVIEPGAAPSESVAATDEPLTDFVLSTVMADPVLSATPTATVAVGSPEAPASTELATPAQPDKFDLKSSEQSVVVAVEVPLAQAASQNSQTSQTSQTSQAASSLLPLTPANPQTLIAQAGNNPLDPFLNLERPPLLLDNTVPPGSGEEIEDIQVRFLNRDGEEIEGYTRSSVFIREFKLEPGTIYDSVEAQRGLDRVLQIPTVREAAIELEPTTDNRAILVILVVERNPVTFGLGTISPFPSALEGPFQNNPVLGVGYDEVTGLAAEVNGRLLNLGGNDQTLTFQLSGGEQVFNTELVFTDPWIADDPTGFAVNVFNQRSVQAVFEGGEREVDLPNGNIPWVHRWGGGVQVFRPFSTNFRMALGVNYQQVSVHNSAFETQTFSRDELGEQLVISEDGTDDLLTASLAADLDRRNNLSNPTRGNRLRLGLDQSIPIGAANVNFTRLSGSFTQFIPLNLFGFAEGPRTLVVTTQAGTMFGEVPPYEAFNLSSGLLRGYGGDQLGTGTSFALAAAEYRFPIVNFNLFNRPVGLGGSLFTGYGTLLGTQDEVVGQPGISRDKPGDGWGYGLGLRALTDFGILRLEVSLNDNGEGQVLFTVGDRF